MRKPWYEVVTDDPADANIRQWGRCLYWVESRSRGGKEHLCDLEGFHDDEDGQKVHIPTFCTCEAFRYHNHRPCWHLIASLFYAIDIIPVDTKSKRAVLREFQRTNNVAGALWLLADKPAEPQHVRNYVLNRNEKKRYTPRPK